MKIPFRVKREEYSSPNGYDAIDSAFTENTFFLITVSPNQQQPSLESEFYCKYIAHGELKPGTPSAKRLQDKELIQILQGPLPDPNTPEIEIESPVITNYILLKDGPVLYGIFEKNLTSDSLGIQTLKVNIINSPLVTQAKYAKSVLKFEQNEIPPRHIISATLGTEKLHFLSNVVELIKAHKIERQDYMSNSDILRFGGDILEKTSPQAFKKSQIQLYQKNLSTSKIFGHKPMLEKFFSVISEIDSAAEENVGFIKKILSSDAGQEVLRNVLATSPDILREYAKSEYLKQQSDIDAKLVSSKDRQKELESKIKETEARLGEVNRELQVTESANAPVPVAPLSAKGIERVASVEAAEIASSKILLAEVKAKLEQKEAELASHSRWETIEDALRAQAAVREHIDKEIKDREERKARVEQELSAHEYELKKKLFEMKPYVEALTGFTPETLKQAISHKVDIIDALKDAKGALDGRDALIENLTAFFQKRHHRDYARHEIANVLITTQQSFITVLAGLPGAGKTSLVRLFSEALGIKTRLLEISVGRGWTSSRDLIGYFNPLVGKFQGSQTGFYNYLQETKADTFSTAANSIVLLDEANLSPIEHYWSSFMNMSDDPAKRQLVFGNEPFTLPQNLRFLATINYDNTTEPLSQRMIDRAPIISLSTSSGFSAGSSIEDEAEMWQPPRVYSSHIMEQWFGNPSRETELNLNYSKILDEIDSACSRLTQNDGKPIILSHRKKDAIRRYCKQAYPIMRTERDNLAIDFAVSQHILPLIDGQGEAYRHRLLGLLEILEKHSLQNSADLMNRVLEYGKQDLDSYNFFAF